MSYVPEITNNLKNVFNKIDMCLVHRNNNKLSNQKRQKNNSQKSGIYRIQCSECDAVYIGQTKRSIHDLNALC